MCMQTVLYKGVYVHINAANGRCSVNLDGKHHVFLSLRGAQLFISRNA